MSSSQTPLLGPFLAFLKMVLVQVNNPLLEALVGDWSCEKMELVRVSKIKAA